MKKLTTTNYIASAILWCLGLLVLLFNLLGLWDAWVLVGLIFHFVVLVPLVIAIVALSKSVKLTDAAQKKACTLHNGIVLAISAVMSALTLFVFSTWFW